MAWANLNAVFTKLSGTTNIDALIDPDHPTYNFELPGLNNTITYSFTTPYPISDMPTHIYSMTEAQKTDVRQVLDYVHQVTGINFTEQTNPSSGEQIFFGYSDQIPHSNSAIDYWHYNYTTTTGGQVDTLAIHDNIIMNSESVYQDLSPGQYGYQVLLHEMGHALGLKHPFEGSPTLPAGLDDDNQTLMSYTLTGANHTTYGPLDLGTLNWIYGGDGLGGTMYSTTTSTPVATPPTTPVVTDPFQTFLTLLTQLGNSATSV